MTVVGANHQSHVIENCVTEAQWMIPNTIAVQLKQHYN